MAHPLRPANDPGGNKHCPARAGRGDGGRRLWAILAAFCLAAAANEAAAGEAERPPPPASSPPTSRPAAPATRPATTQPGLPVLVITVRNDGDHTIAHAVGRLFDLSDAEQVRALADALRTARRARAGGRGAGDLEAVIQPSGR